jgi:hypothetical protein
VYRMERYWVIKRWLQQLHKERLQSLIRNDVSLIEQVASPSVHQDVRRRDVVDRRVIGRPSQRVGGLGCNTRSRELDFLDTHER